MSWTLTVHDRQMSSRERAERRAAIAFVAPAVLTLAALTVGPALWVLWLSLRERVPVFGIDRFSGLGHYAFLATDPRFWSALRPAGRITASEVLPGHTQIRTGIPSRVTARPITTWGRSGRWSLEWP